MTDAWAQSTTGRRTHRMDRKERLLTQIEAERKAKAAKTPEEIADEERRMEAARAHKEKLLAIDAERSRKGAQKAPEELEAEMKQQAEIRKAYRTMDEGLDEVKYMNKVVQYAKTLTIRDSQKDEKKAIASERKEDEKRLDMMMEMERLKALRMYEEREQKRIEDRRRGAAVIRAQMEEREQERLRQQELKQQEQDAMLRHIEKMRNDDRREAARKREASRHLMEEVALANAEQIRLKTRQREMEMEEERRIAEYLRERDRREQEVADEQERLRAEKEREIARLRSMQERAQDKRAELDALRAKRAQESYERDWRRKEKEEAEHRSIVNRELGAAREQQRMEKEMLLAQQAMIENEEFERIIAVQRVEDDVERDKRDIERQKRLAHAQEIKEQIALMHERRKKDRREFIEEGNKLKKQREEEQAKLERIRAEKLHLLADQGVPPQYRSELLRKRNPEPLRPAQPSLAK